MDILVVDDSAFFRKAISNELEKQGHYVVQAESGESALETLREQQFNIVLLDIEMPGINGVETAGHIRDWEKSKNLENSRIVFLTGLDSIALREKGYELNATDFISKSLNASDVIECILGKLHPERMFAGCKVLLVEDSSVARNITSNILQESGFEVHACVDGQEAVNFLKKHNVDLDLILTDKEMPNLNGLELTKTIRNDFGYKNIPIIVLSADPRREEIVKLLDSGVNDYITKPFIREEFFSRINSSVLNYRVKKAMIVNIEELKTLVEVNNKLLSACSHDFKSPLNSILGFSEIMLENESDPEKIDYLTRVRKSGEFLLSMVNDLLDLRCFEFDRDYKINKINMNTVIISSIEQMEGSAKLKGISIESDLINTKENDFLGNDVAFVRALNNLISNSIKFSRDESKIKIFTSACKDFLNITIEDFGVGMSPEQLERIKEGLEKHSTIGTRGEKGTGLGMRIVNSILTQHKCQLKIDSTTGEGTRFCITLPKS